MFFKQLATKESSLSYFLGCGSLGKSIAVDVVAGDEEWYIEEAKKAAVTITHVIDTHVHADHYSGGRKLAHMVGAHYCLHESDAAFVKFPFTPLHDGDIIEIGNVAVKVLHTPGHTLDSVCLAVSDNRRAEQTWFVITGDTLFVGSVGRPDLAGREKEMAGKLFDSLGLEPAELLRVAENLRFALDTSPDNRNASLAPLLPQRYEQLTWLGLSPVSLQVLAERWVPPPQNAPRPMATRSLSRR